MPTNIEIKARVQDLDAVRQIAEQITDRPCTEIVQDDTFFRITRGRLKLRKLGPGSGQLIYYQRTDQVGPKRSEYFVTPTSDPEGLKAVLATALGVRGQVRKVRHLYWVGQTRIHLDQVEGLGSFVELEVMLQADQSDADGTHIARELMARLGIADADLLEGAYMDLLEVS